MIAPITPASAIPDPQSLAVSPAKAASGVDAATPFGELLREGVSQISSLEGQAHAAVDGLMSGSGVDVHQTMIATQKASMAFELALALRNKAVQAYQSVMGMQF